MRGCVGVAFDADVLRRGSDAIVTLVVFTKDADDGVDDALVDVFSVGEGLPDALVGLFAEFLLNGALEHRSCPCLLIFGEVSEEILQALEFRFTQVDRGFG